MQVSFRKRATNYRARLRKMTCEDKASYGSSPPCTGYCIWRVIESQSPHSIALVSFQRNVVKET